MLLLGSALERFPLAVFDQKKNKNKNKIKKSHFSKHLPHAGADHWPPGLGAPPPSCIAADRQRAKHWPLEGTPLALEKTLRSRPGL